MFIALFFAFINCILYGDKKTAETIMSWMLAYGTTFAIVEPVQVFMLASTPCLFVEDHACGRCMIRARTIYNELLAP